MDLFDVALFRVIASSGSLSAAARSSGSTPMAVSRRLAALEAAIGARLFHRTTRSLSLTPEGEAFLPHATALLETQEAALASVTPEAAGLKGVLKVTAPNVIGHTIVTPVVARLIGENPSLSVDLTLGDGVVDLVERGLDMAIRVAPLEPSDMIAARLGDNPRVLCASPDYLRREGMPAFVADLADHPCILLHGIDEWPFRREGQVERVRVKGPFSANTVDAVRAACLAGVGIAMMTYWDVWQQLRDGDLERIELRDARTDHLAIWAVYPTHRYVPARVRALIDATKAHLASAAGQAGSPRIV